MVSLQKHFKQAARWASMAAALALSLAFSVAGWGRGPLNVYVVDANGSTITSGFRYLVQEDNTLQTPPQVAVPYSTGVDIHKSYAPVITKGVAPFGMATVNGLPDDTPLYVSVLPNSGYNIAGAMVTPTQTSVYITVQSTPIPTAQLFIYAFEDHFPINNVPDAGEPGLGGFTVILSDNLGPISVDVNGNPLGTEYDADWNVTKIGTGVITTMTAADVNDPLKNPYGLQVGEALVKYIAPGKYGTVVIPPTGSNWVQTATIEGTPTVDGWVKAGEPRLFTEGFGTGSWHVFFGYVDNSQLPWNQTPPAGTGVINGTLRYNHFGAPPNNQLYFAGTPPPESWIGLNDTTTNQGLYAAEADPETGEFTISGVPPGTYQIVWWDKPLDNLFGFQTVVVPPGPGGTGDTVDLGNILVLRWFGSLEGSVFWDDGGGDPAKANNGFEDPGEHAIADWVLNLRFRDGTMYQSTITNIFGEYSFSEVFPFFKWLVAEVDYARYRPTGYTAVVDAGGPFGPDNGWAYPSLDKLNPQPQTDPASWPVGTTPALTPINNPNTGNNLSRTYAASSLTDLPLLQATQIYLNQFNVLDWGKNAWPAGYNGGITGIVYYATTRAENDPRYSVGEDWEPGIPRVQLNLYIDANADGAMDDLDGDGLPTVADVDNYPFGWADGSAPKGPEDVDHNSNGVFDPGDAVQISYTDSFDDKQPTGCHQVLPVVHGTPIRDCTDNYGTWNQILDGVFDGGYAFVDYFPGGMANAAPGDEPVHLGNGMYIVEAVPPPGYTLLKEEDKNVDFGPDYVPGPNLIPAPCIGNPANGQIDYIVPAELTLFPGVPAPFAGEHRPLCNMRQVRVNSASNAATNFFFFTEVPVAARVVGFVLNDLSAEFQASSPIFGEKAAAPWLPISFQDFAGNEVAHVYSDEWGSYNALLPSTYAISVPSPTGVGPSMITACLNYPLMKDPTDPQGKRMIPDPFFNPNFGTTCWTLDYYPGRTSYLDTPILPSAGFVEGYVDAASQTGTPEIATLDGDQPGGGAYVCDTGGTITLTSRGTVTVTNPYYDPDVVGSQPTVQRDFGFGLYDLTSSLVTLNGAPLAIVSWTDATIVATVPPGASSGHVSVTRADTGRRSSIGFNLSVVDCATACVVRVGPSQAFTSIQAAIDDPGTTDGCVVLVDPGVYLENPILYKPITLQGAGRSTIISAQPAPVDRLNNWHVKIRQILGLGPTDPYTANEAPGIMVLGQLANGGTGFSAGNHAVIDGFYITGSQSGGGIYLDTMAHYTEVAHNIIQSNRGNQGAGITVGNPDLPGTPGLPGDNTHVYIHHNEIVKNGAVTGGGGISLWAGADDYRVEDNFISGNFTEYNGAGIMHEGLSDNGAIRHNRILFNEVFTGTAVGGSGGGIWVGDGSAAGALSTGAGDVTIEGNLIQGNMAGAGKGGGIRADHVNGQDVQAAPGTPTSWYELNIFNNIIVNNVATVSGGGISLQDAARVNIVNDTVADNDSVSTAIVAFPAGSTVSTPAVSGIESGYHSLALRSIPGFTQTYSDPVLEDSIVWHNRSYYFDLNANAGFGSLFPNPAGLYQDLKVTQTPTGTELLDPQYCVLTSTAGYAGTNVSGDPLFVLSYFNDLKTAKVVDEAGNNVSVLYSPLSQSAGEYHLSTTSSSAFNLGRSQYWSPGVGYPAYPDLGSDYDRQYRPRFVYPDAGADELHPAFIPFGNLQVQMSAVPDPVAVNQPLTIAVTVTNAGPDPVDGVVAVTQLPGTALLNGAVASQGTLSIKSSSRGGNGHAAQFVSGDTLYSDVGTLLSGATATVMMTVTPTAVGPQPSSSVVDGVVEDTAPADNTADVAPVAMPDADGDAAYDAIDCKPNDSTVWSAPGSVGNLTLGGIQGASFAWLPPAAPGSTTLAYDVLRSALPGDFSSATCVASNLSAASATVPEVPPAGTAYFYLISAKNACGGSVAQAPACP